MKFLRCCGLALGLVALVSQLALAEDLLLYDGEPGSVPWYTPTGCIEYAENTPEAAGCSRWAWEDQAAFSLGSGCAIARDPSKSCT